METVGVIASHEDYPVERIKLDRRRKWLGSVSHDECIKLIDVENLFEDSDEEVGEDAKDGIEEDEADHGETMEVADEDIGADDSESEKEVVKTKKKKKGKAVIRDSGRSEKTKERSNAAFFAEL